MREARAGTVIVRGRGSARFGASCSPPARGEAGKFTHFRAAYFRFGMRAAAVAAARGNGAGGAGCVRAKNQSGREEQRSEEDEPQERAAEASLEREGRDHEGECERRLEKNHWRSGIGRFRTEVLGRSRRGGAEKKEKDLTQRARRSQRNKRSGACGRIPGRDVASSDSKLRGKIGSA